MKHVRNLLNDLVERKLWPIALALVVILVAVPVMLGKATEEPIAADPTPPAKLDASQTQRAAVTVEAEDDEREDRAGKTRNPFKQQHVQKAQDGAADTTATGTGTDAGTTGGSGTTGTGTGGTGTGGTGTSGSGGSTDPKPKADTKPKADAGIDTVHSYEVDLKFGLTEKQKKIDDVARLAPLPDADHPFFVFLGILEDGKTAVFLISSDVKATGDGTCRPSSKSCETIELKKGETEYFDMTADNAPVQYQLDVVKIERRSSSAKASVAAVQAEARTAAMRHSKAGAELLRDAYIWRDPAFNGSKLYRWLPETGLLERIPAKTLAKVSAQADGDDERAGDDPVVELPGKPVWHFRVDR